MALSKSPPKGLQCLYMFDTYAWQPAHTTTYILPVYEIENVVTKLNTLIKRMNSSQLSGGVREVSKTILQLQNQTKNWQTVLSNYREYNSDLTAMFSAETLQFVQMVRAFGEWRSGTITDNDFVNVVDNVGKGNLGTGSMAQTMFDRALSNSFTQVKQSCSNVIPSYQNNYMSAICNDFSANQWSDFSSVLYGSCIMPEIKSDGSSKTTSPLSQSKLAQHLCQERAAASASNLPTSGGKSLITNGPDSMFGFLTDISKYLTFGAGSPLTITWTSTIKDTLTQEVHLDIDQGEAGTFGGTQEVNPVAYFFHMDQQRGHNNGYSVSLGKSSDSSHTYERTVSVTFDDDDNGE